MCMKIAASLVFTVSLFAQPSRPIEQFTTKAGPLKITPIRHASLVMEAGGTAVHVDPWSQGNYDGIPAADLILITDIHGDHLDPKAIEKVRKAGAKLIAPKAVAEKLGGDVIVLNNGDRQVFGSWTIEAVPMYNLKRGPSEGKLFHDKGRGNGYVVNYGDMRLYISGDTEAVPEMRTLKNIDVAFVTMNLPYTMPPEEAAEGVKAFHPKVVYPYHYRGSDLSVFEKALAGSGIEVRVRNWYY
ncbi:MAG: MBL fold metallo-hydrolase [Acidobacteria bacterium]|nr:MBL fold metallo-hydrolase [Acidobacteriota bacterium]